MRDYIFSLTLLSIFLGAYTALVLGYAKPIESSRSARSAQTLETPARDPSATQQVAEPTAEIN